MTTAIALFNNKGGVGKTTLTYHLANMQGDGGRQHPDAGRVVNDEDRTSLRI
ncbi:MAG TPA: hypothetical protein VM142_14245 [Acidimicrobiales bacterium]|nr:hypothetical protein [Acidimicrobiales bacterium]